MAAAVLQAAQLLAPPGAQVSVGAVAGASFMPACTGKLGVSLSGVAPYEQAAVRCPAPAWTLYVMVTLAQSEPVVVAALPVAAGQVIGPDDVMLRDMPVQDFAGREVFADPAQLIGASALMSLAAGMVITQPSVQAPELVKAGQPVIVHVYSGGVEVSLQAMAEQAGRIGDTILLTNPRSGRRFSAEVTAQGVELRLQ